MKKYILSLLVILCGLTTASAKDCGPTLQTVTTSDPVLYTEEGNVCLSFDMDITGLDLGKNQEVVYTPVLVSADGTQGAEFGKIVVKGRNSGILSKRHGAKKIEDVALDIVKTADTEATVSYMASVPYEEWMDDASLYLSEDLCGCGAIQSSDKKELIASNIEAPVAVPEVPEVIRTETITLYAEPLLEEPKIRHEKGNAFVDFVVNRFEINPGYHNNYEELAKIIASIDLVKNDPNVNITNIDLHGYASPEGDYNHNAWLAENRTKAVANYVKALYPIRNSLFSQHSTPEDWDGLKKFVTDSNIAYRNEILYIIADPVMTPDQKDAMIKNNYPETYEYMLKNWYPQLRRTDYTISYEVRPFSPEEALKIMKVSPKQVSLFEMFAAAQSLGVNTPGYNEVIEIAVNTYPEEPVALYNAAVVAINRGEYDKARKYLAQLPQDAETLNLLGMVEINTGNYAKARTYLKKAVEMGSTQAPANLRLIENKK